MNISRKIYEGADIKVKLNIVAEGFSMIENDFSVKVYTDKNPTGVTLDKRGTEPSADIPLANDGSYVILLHSSDIGTGTYYMETTAYIPDLDFGTTRIEKDVKVLCNVEPVPFAELATKYL